MVTIFQEIAALWPVNLLGEFIDRLDTGDMGNTVWLLLGASLFYPGLLRANVILRHKMFYETDFRKRVEIISAGLRCRPLDRFRIGGRALYQGRQRRQRHHQRRLSHPGQLYAR